ncbi:Lipoxygenase homology domain-containing protein 1 [Taenia crassiceps]|uniref:Lipoxygenase homology domain-containing protein 1 n=1 Tax=Taenia crassiceps TaxID=6207 RepID=A0ABR4QP72_9CEST
MLEQPPYGIILKQGTSSESQVKCREVGEISWILLENKGTKPEDGVLLASVQITHLSTNRTWLFPIGKWLFHCEGDPPAICGFKGMRVKLTDYRITVVTGDFDGAGTDSRVFLVMFGEHGESPQFKLPFLDQRDLFSSGAVSKFIIRTANLGDISHVRVSRDASGSKSGWFLKRIIVEDPSRPQCCYLFNCNDWISLSDSTNVNNSCVIRKEMSHIPSVYEYHVAFHTLEFRGAGTPSDIFLKLYGREGSDRERWFSNHSHQFGVDGSCAQFRLKTDQRLGDLIKIKVGLESKAQSPGWLLEKVVVEDLTTKKVYTFPCGQWLVPETDGATISRQLLVSRSRTLTPTIAHQQFEMTLTSRTENIQEKPADVYFRLFGPKAKHFDKGNFDYSIRMGNFTSPHNQCSPIICIPGEQINTNGKTLVTFSINDCQRLSPSSQLALGHDAPFEAADWLLEKVQLKSLNTGITQTFWCKKWFPFYDNKLKERTVGPQYTVMPSKKTTDANWQVEVYTSNLVGAGTSARVYMTLYGDRGKTDEICLNETLTSNRNILFQQSSRNTFKLNLPRIGIPYKMRIRHDGTGHSPNWHLEKVVLQHPPTEKTYFFACDKWLNSEDAGRSCACEMPAFGSDIAQPALVCYYRVTVETGEHSVEHLDSKVHINIFGSMGDTGVRRLCKKGAFSRGKRNKTDTAKKSLTIQNRSASIVQVDEFLIEAVALGVLEKVRIGHDGIAPTQTWFLDKVTVEEVGNSANKTVFELNDWVATRRLDGSYEEEIYPTKRATEANYTVRTRTGEMLDAGTDAKIYISLKGDIDEVPFVRLKHSQADSGRFRIGQEDIFHFCGPFVGKIESAKVMLERKDKTSTWYLKHLSITVNEVSLRYHFTADRWLSKTKSDDKKVYEFTPFSIERIFSATPYEITFYTGNESNCGQDTLVYLQLFGNKGAKQTEVLLFKTEGGIFSAGSVDKFNVYSSEVGDITKIRVGQSGKGPSSRWLLKEIRIRKPSTHVCTYCHGEVCPNLQLARRRIADDARGCENDFCDCCMHWPKKSNDMTLLSLENRPLDDYWFFAERWLPPRDDESGQRFCELLPAKADGTPLSLEKTTVYQVRIRTGDLPGGGTSAQVYLTLVGEKSESGEFIFPNPKGRVFAKDREAVFKVEAIGLGKVSKIRLRHDNSGPNPDWYLREVIVSEDENGDGRVYYFPCNLWLAATSDGSGRLLREFAAVSTRQRRVRPAKPFIVDYASENPPMERKGRFPSASPSSKRAEDRASTKFATSAIVPPAQRKSEPVISPESRVPPMRETTSPSTSSISTVGHVEEENELATAAYKVLITTGIYSGSGALCNVYLKICGENGETGKIVLTDTRKNDGNTKKAFESGSTDNFLIQAPDIGELRRIRLGHDNIGPPPTWYVEKVEVESTKTGAVTTFPCNRWIEKSGESGEVYVDLPFQPTSSIPIQPTTFYEFKIYTSSIQNAGTAASVYIMLTGSKGQKTSEVQLKGVFEQGGCEVLYVDLEDVGEPLRSLHIKHNKEGANADWHLDRVEVRPMESKLPAEEVYIFKCNRWLSDLGKTEVILHATTGRREPPPPVISKEESTYEIALTTGTLSKSAVPTCVYLGLIDADGRKEERQVVPVKGSTKFFQPGKTDTFIWEAVPLREVARICLRYDNTNLSPSWYVDKVTVRRIKSQESQEPIKTFICNRWISSVGDEFIPVSSKVSTTSPPSFRDSRPFDPPGANVELPEIPSLENLPPVPFDSSVPSSPLDMPLPSPPPTGFNGRPQIPTVQHESNGVATETPHGSLDPLPSSPSAKEEEVPYRITLTTGNHEDLGTRGPLLMNLIGLNGASTGWLSFQNQAGSAALPAGSIKTFVFNAPSLKEITAIEVYNRAEEQDERGWHLKHLRVELPHSQMTYEIPYNAWLTAKKSTDSAYHRLTITPQYLVKKHTVSLNRKPFHTLKLWVDGSVPENLRDKTSLQVRGDQEPASEVVIVNRDWTPHSRLLTLQFQVKNDLKSFDRIRIQFWPTNEREIEAELRISSAILQRDDEMTSRQYYFTEWQLERVDQRVYRCCELTCFPPAKPPVTSYKIRIKTSDLPNANTNANVYIRLIGEIIESADIHLKESETTTTPFERNQIDQFTVKNLSSLGELTGCRLWHDNRMHAGAWHCEWIYVIEVLPEGSYLSPQSWYFPCNRWLRGDGRSQVVPLDLLPLDAKAAPALALREPEVNKSSQEEALKVAVEPHKRMEKTDYFIEVETSNANEAGTKHTGWLQIKGRNGISPVLKLTDPDGNLVLQTGSTDNFRMKCGSLGVLQQIYVGLHDPNIHFDEDEEEPKYVNLQLNRQNQWNCRSILVTDGRDGETYLFNINQWIVATPEIDRRNCVAARPAELRILKQKKTESPNEVFDSSTAPTVTYRVSIETGDDENAGTTANAYITLYGNLKGATSGSQRLQRISNQTFAREKVDVFFISCAKLGEVNRIQIEHDNAGPSPEWFVKSVTVKDTSSGDTWVFPCYAWLSLTRGSKSLRKELKSL